MSAELIADGQHIRATSSEDRVDVICDAFEDAWRRGELPDIEEFLRRAESVDIDSTFTELVLLDIEYRQARGLPTSPDDYLARFPHFASQIEAVQFALPPTTTDGIAGSRLQPAKPAQTARVGRFELIGRIGSGASGEVWKAFDPRLQRTVAVKLAHASELEAHAIHGFLREARAAAQLRHPHIVAVHEVGREAGAVFIVSDLIEGTDLRQHLAGGRFELRSAAAFCATVAEALHVAHEQGIVHRDLKPANILIDAMGRPHITDFGLAKWQSDGRSSTLPGRIIGTPAYMSPEQARGAPASVDRRSDVFALTVVLYELLTGRCPFDGDHAQVLAAIIDRDVPNPRMLEPTIPRDLETICLKGLEKAPSRRYGTAQELADDLRRFLRGEAPRARRAGAVQKTWRGIRRRQALAAAVVFGATSLGALATVRKVAQTNRTLRGMQVVTLATDPPKAEILFIPLSEADGQPLPAKLVKAKGRSPVTQELEPGHYLVVAVLDAERFHEVERQVPKNPHETPLGFNHNSWKLRDSGIVELPTILIPSKDITRDMVLVSAAGDATSHDSSAAGRVDAPFYIDRSEFTWGQFRREINRGRWPVDQASHPPPVNAPMPAPYNQAAMYAELTGARLPTEIEYARALATLAVAEETMGTANAHAGDRRDSDQVTPIFRGPLLGLNSGFAEWTSSWGSAGATSSGFNASDDVLLARQFRIVWDGGKQRRRQESSSDRARDSLRVAFPREMASPHVGFRRARSAHPRYYE